MGAGREATGWSIAQAAQSGEGERLAGNRFGSPMVYETLSADEQAAPRSRLDLGFVLGFVKGRLS